MTTYHNSTTLPEKLGAEAGVASCSATYGRAPALRGIVWWGRNVPPLTVAIDDLIVHMSEDTPAIPNVSISSYVLAREESSSPVSSRRVRTYTCLRRVDQYSTLIDAVNLQTFVAELLPGARLLYAAINPCACGEYAARRSWWND